MPKAMINNVQVEVPEGTTVLNAAKQAGIKTVVLPARNKKDLPDVPKEARRGLKFHFVRNTNEVLKTAIAT